MKLLGQKIQGFQLADVSVFSLKMDFINCALFFPLCLLYFLKS